MENTMNSSTLNSDIAMSEHSERKMSFLNKILTNFDRSEIGLINLVLLKLKTLLTYLLANIKQNLVYYLNQKDNLERLQINLEEIIIRIENLNDSENKFPESILNINYIFEKTIIFFKCLFEYDSNTTFLELYCHFFLKVLKKIFLLYRTKSRSVFQCFSNQLNEIYELLIEKKIECVDKLRDSKIIIKILKIIYKLIEINEQTNENFNLNKLINYLFISRENIFFLCNDIFLDKINKIISNICKLIFLKNINDQEIIKFGDILFNKILEISKSKDDLKMSLEYNLQVYVVNSLIMCLKLTLIIIEKSFHLETFRNAIIEKLTRSLIELSFWENSSIVEYTCKIFSLLWSKLIRTYDCKIKSELEKIMDFFFIRRYQTFFSQLGDSDDCNIKLSVLEIVTQRLNELIKNEHFVLFCFLNYDLCKVRYNFMSQLLNQIKNYFNLQNPKYNLLKRFLTITYLHIFNYITSCTDLYMSHNQLSNIQVNKEFLKIYQKDCETWEEVIKAINSGGYKNIIKKINDIFDVKINPKSKENQEEYRSLAKMLALLLRNSIYVEIDKFHEVFGQKDAFSKMVLEEYMNLFNFIGLDILKAYRIFISTFKLGGESDVIYNLILGFSQKYFNDNKDGIVKTVDDVSTFAYSILMLNTDLHNPLVKEHMAQEAFIKNNQLTGMDLPVDFQKSVYKSILNDPLRIPNQRLFDYSKYDEMYYIIGDKKAYYEKHLFNNIMRLDDNPVYLPLNISFLNKKVIGKDNYPLIDCFESFTFTVNSDTFKNPYVIDCIYLFWEEFFYNFMSIPYKFFELNDENVFKTVKQFCAISRTFKDKENIDKLILSLNQIIISDNIKKSNALQLYNIFFTISIEYSKNFQSYLEIYFNSIINILKHKVFYDNQDLNYNYHKTINDIITKTFLILCEKNKTKKSTSGSYFFSIFGNKKEEIDLTMDQYKTKIWNLVDGQFKRDHIIDNSNSPENSSCLISLNKITQIIREQEEEFIFFATFAASKTLNYTDKSEIYFSLIFLNEIMTINDKKFGKIWPNLLNITRDKLEFKSMFDNEENLFDIMFLNFVITEIMSRFMNVIEIEDYLLILERYLEAENYDVLLLLMESNDKVLRSIDKNILIKKEVIFTSVLVLLIKLINQYSTVILISKNFEQFEKLSHSFILLRSLLENLTDYSNLSSESFDLLNNLIKILIDNNIIDTFMSYSQDITIIFEIVQLLANKLQVIMKAVEDEKWDFYFKIIEFCFRIMIFENEGIQKMFTSLSIKLFKTPPIPLVKFRELSLLLNQFLISFNSLKIKYDLYWIHIFDLFDGLFRNNENLYSSSNDFDLVFSAMKKYLICFVDYNKKAKRYYENDYKLQIDRIYLYLTEKAKSFNEKSSVWESGKNLFKLYFSDIK